MSAWKVKNHNSARISKPHKWVVYVINHIGVASLKWKQLSFPPTVLKLSSLIICLKCQCKVCVVKLPLRMTPRYKKKTICQNSLLHGGLNGCLGFTFYFCGKFQKTIYVLDKMYFNGSWMVYYSSFCLSAFFPLDVYWPVYSLVDFSVNIFFRFLIQSLNVILQIIG